MHTVRPLLDQMSETLGFKKKSSFFVQILHNFFLFWANMALKILGVTAMIAFIMYPS